VLPGTVRSLRPQGIVFRRLSGRLPRAETAVAYRRDDAIRNAAFQSKRISDDDDTFAFLR